MQLKIVTKDRVIADIDTDAKHMIGRLDDLPDRVRAILQMDIDAACAMVRDFTMEQLRTIEPGVERRPIPFPVADADEDEVAEFRAML